MKITKKLLGLAIAFMLAGCNESNWTGFVYPDIEDIPRADEVQNFTIGNYKTFEECQIAVINRVRNNYEKTGIQGDYQCGYKCTHRDDYDGMLICEETRK